MTDTVVGIIVGALLFAGINKLWASKLFIDNQIRVVNESLLEFIRHSEEQNKINKEKLETINQNNNENIKDIRELILNLKIFQEVNTRASKYCTDKVDTIEKDSIYFQNKISKLLNDNGNSNSSLGFSVISDDMSMYNPVVQRFSNPLPNPSNNHNPLMRPNPPTFVATTLLPSQDNKPTEPDKLYNVGTRIDTLPRGVTQDFSENIPDMHYLPDIPMNTKDTNDTEETKENIHVTKKDINEFIMNNPEFKDLYCLPSESSRDLAEKISIELGFKKSEMKEDTEEPEEPEEQDTEESTIGSYSTEEESKEFKEYEIFFTSKQQPRVSSGMDGKPIFKKN